MTDTDWDPANFLFSFPDEPAYEGALVDMPLMHKVEKVRHFIMDEVLKEIVRAVSTDAVLAGLVLCIALIDYITGYYVGKESKGENYRDFLARYFPDAYTPFIPAIYRDLRCGLMHNLTTLNPWKRTEESFDIHSNNPQHLAKAESGKIIFSVLVFAEDIRRAWIMYMHDLVMKKDTYPELVINFEKRFNRLQGRGAFMVKTPD